MSDIEIFFDGYCPESLLKGKKVEMRLNEDDFWESEETGLQICIFPPYATLLKWRGEGKFRSSSPPASEQCKGLVMVEPSMEDGQEKMPNQDKILGSNFALEWYLDLIYESKAAFDVAKFDPNDPAIKKQKEYLNSLSAKDFAPLFRHYDALMADTNDQPNTDSSFFSDFHSSLYDLKIIFDFNWMAWYAGAKIINDESYDYSDSSLLDISMYLTTIFRADRFSDGAIDHHFEKRTIPKLIEALKSKVVEKE